jgi:hypothetical protein
VALLVDPQQRYPDLDFDSDWSRLNVMDFDWLVLNINERWTLTFNQSESSTHIWVAQLGHRLGNE